MLPNLEVSVQTVLRNLSVVILACGSRPFHPLEQNHLHYLVHYKDENN